MLHNSCPKLATPAASVRPSHLSISHISVALRLTQAPAKLRTSRVKPATQGSLSTLPTARNEVRMGRSAMPLQRKLGVSPGRQVAYIAGPSRTRTCFHACAVIYRYMPLSP
ncbi:uncharacterized protein TrAtP1_006084 [Trichoderma atroviride]|uniref:uncharacterized protein n=1 Tax=Hypocrea atroviridis TaxID=63577 RepID=UPI00331670EC|nr:hypothetical protein TrAtP1_006084 [Trichoderma atroviride]